MSCEIFELRLDVGTNLRPGARLAEFSSDSACRESGPSGSQTRRASPLAGASWTAGVRSFTGLHVPVFSLIAVGRSGWQYFAAMLLSSFRSHAWCRFCVCLRLLQGRCKLCSQCICVTWSQRSRRLARVPETLQKLLAVGHQSDASAHWGVGLAAGSEPLRSFGGASLLLCGQYGSPACKSRGASGGDFPAWGFQRCLPKFSGWLAMYSL